MLLQPILNGVGAGGGAYRGSVDIVPSYATETRLVGEPPLATSASSVLRSCVRVVRPVVMMDRALLYFFNCFF